MMLFYVALGGIFGAVSRYAIIRILEHKKMPFYVATAVVNIIGSFFMGIALRMTLEQFVWGFIGIGFLGAFTTFSTFAFDSVRLCRAKKLGKAFTYTVCTVVLSFVCIWIGYNL